MIDVTMWQVISGLWFITAVTCAASHFLAKLNAKEREKLIRAHHERVVETKDREIESLTAEIGQVREMLCQSSNANAETEALFLNMQTRCGELAAETVRLKDEIYGLKLPASPKRHVPRKVKA